MPTSQMPFSCSPSLGCEDFVPKRAKVDDFGGDFVLSPGVEVVLPESIQCNKDKYGEINKCLTGSKQERVKGSFILSTAQIPSIV